MTQFGKSPLADVVKAMTLVEKASLVAGNVLNNKINKARELLLSDDIEAADLQAVKMEAEREIGVLESKISE